MSDSLSVDAETVLPGAVRATEDLFRAVNGSWLTTAEIPADKPSAGAFDELRDQAEEAVRDIITGLGDSGDELPPEHRLIADLYASFSDTDRIAELGTSPLQPVLAEVDAVADPADLIQLTGSFARRGIAGLVGFDSEADPGDPQRVVLFVGQAGLGLPDEQYYRDPDKADLREQYREHISASLELAGVPDAADQAAAVLELETEIAARHWDKVRTRDLRQAYNLMTSSELAELAPGVAWDRYWAGSELPEAAIAEVVAMQPSFFSGIGDLLVADRLEAWRSWARWRVVSSLSPYLPDAFVAERFRFYGTVLSGTPTLKERWKRGVDLVEGILGEAVGQVYVERHFSPNAKGRMDELVEHLIGAYRESITSLSWMTDATRERALDKLSKFTPKIGYPEKWRDFSGLRIEADDLVGNAMRGAAFTLDWRMSKIGEPTDPDEWLMTPQTVNAYYHPLRNEIVFPAAILQPPFFDEEASDAVNFGGIGAVIGHEIGHGFDDQGSTCDGDGRLVDWWTADDRTAFEDRTGRLIAQYAALEPAQLPGLRVNGELTIGENIGDLGGLGIAIKAYRRSRGGEAGVDELTELFSSWARIWRYVARDEHAKQRLITDPHSPAEFRCNQVVRNLDEFHTTFGVTPDDPMWLDPEERITIW